MKALLGLFYQYFPRGLKKTSEPSTVQQQPSYVAFVPILESNKKDVRVE